MQTSIKKSALLKGQANDYDGFEERTKEWTANT